MNSNLSPIDWAKRPLQKYADFSGRAPRAEYWWFALAVVVAYIVAGIIEGIVGINTMLAGVYGPLTALLALALLVPSLAVGVRRLHDTNRSAWWLLCSCHIASQLSCSCRQWRREVRRGSVRRDCSGSSGLFASSHIWS
ncbi:MAG TPA: DUF805 domain-containing protein [Sphingomicrobium sp.]|nr:DUF805 domain-containing protein [Sphingomicrobium sp.]